MEVGLLSCYFRFSGRTIGALDFSLSHSLTSQRVISIAHQQLAGTDFSCLPGIADLERIHLKDFVKYLESDLSAPKPRPLPSTPTRSQPNQ
jgi:hypothetical protein